FKYCKTGGYNLEGSKAAIERLTRLVLLIAIAYTCSTLKGKVIKLKGQEKYIGRLRKIKQSKTKNSNFWRLIIRGCVGNRKGICGRMGRRINEIKS
ncbi:MAG: hypothetical protein ACRDEA_17470, partial [Microcystaceae cyanobacterium]